METSSDDEEEFRAKTTTFTGIGHISEDKGLGRGGWARPEGEKDWKQHYAYFGYVDTYIRTDAARGIHLLTPSSNDWGAESFSD